jgi:hypothetical protein
MEQSQQNREQLYKWKMPGETSATPAAPSPFGQVCHLRPAPFIQSAHLSIAARAAATGAKSIWCPSPARTTNPVGLRKTCLRPARVWTTGVWFDLLIGKQCAKSIRRCGFSGCKACIRPTSFRTDVNTAERLWQARAACIWSARVRSDVYPAECFWKACLWPACVRTDQLWPAPATATVPTTRTVTARIRKYQFLREASFRPASVWTTGFWCDLFIGC